MKHILLNLATRGCHWVKFKFRHASILGEGHLGQRWRIWDPMGTHNNFFTHWNQVITINWQLDIQQQCLPSPFPIDNARIFLAQFDLVFIEVLFALSVEKYMLTRLNHINENNHNIPFGLWWHTTQHSHWLLFPSGHLFLKGQKKISPTWSMKNSNEEFKKDKNGW